MTVYYFYFFFCVIVFVSHRWMDHDARVKLTDWSLPDWQNNTVIIRLVDSAPNTLLTLPSANIFCALSLPSHLRNPFSEILFPNIQCCSFIITARFFARVTWTDEHRQTLITLLSLYKNVLVQRLPLLLKWHFIHICCQIVSCVTYVFGSVTELRSGEDNSNQWMGVTVASQRSPLGRALVSDRVICASFNLPRLHLQFIQLLCWYDTTPDKCTVDYSLAIQSYLVQSSNYLTVATVFEAAVVRNRPHGVKQVHVTRSDFQLKLIDQLFQQNW